MYNIKQHHDYRVYIICVAAFGLPLCARMLSLHWQEPFYTWLPVFCLVHCEGQKQSQGKNSLWRHTKQATCPFQISQMHQARSSQGLRDTANGEGFDSAWRRKPRAAGTKRQPSWDSLLLEGPRRVLGRYRGAYTNLKESTANAHTHHHTHEFHTHSVHNSLLWHSLSFTCPQYCEIIVKSYLCLICYYVVPLGILKKEGKI